MSITLSALIDFCRAEALAGKLYPTELSDYRWFCREYSKTFHTALHIVMQMDPEHVILCVLEDGMDTKRLRKHEDAQSVIEELRRLEDPEYDATREAEFEDWGAGIEEWDAQRVAKGAITPPTKETPKEEPLKDMPKQGFLNLSYLEKEEMEPEGFTEPDDELE